MKPISKEKFEQLKNNNKKVVKIKSVESKPSQENIAVKSQLQATKLLTEVAIRNLNNQNTEILIDLLNKQGQQIETLLKALTAPKELIVNHDKKGIIKTVDIRIVN